MNEAEQARHDTAFGEAVRAFDKFVEGFADDPAEIADEKSGMTGAQLHFICRIVQDEVVEVEATGKDWKLHHRL